MSRRTDRETWLISVQAEGEGPPLPIRIRRFLKSALRQHALRCVNVSAIAGLCDGRTTAGPETAIEATIGGGDDREVVRPKQTRQKPAEVASG